ncbi:MAG TPA: PIG-L family deacetylase [bacterium]|nr:PIG-L family deacetylase [bacterium]
MPRRRGMWGVAAGLLVVAVATWYAPGRGSGWAPHPDAALGSPVVATSETRERVTAGDSVVVFAAHPDDEALGAGGLIHAAVLAGARVHIVFFTNGDGYLEGVDVGFHTLLSTPDRFIQYGQRRQREGVAAAARIGLSVDRLTFLGYPDRGLAVLWGPGWTCDHLYTSPYTRHNRSPYSPAGRPGVGYCGQHVLEDVERVLRRERPTIIVSHHAEDTHRDHWAAGAFVMAALEHLRAEDVAWAKTVRVWPYLVHHARWPVPQAYAPDLPLVPPGGLLAAGAAWTEYPLDQTDQDAKRMAILEYHTQTQLLRAYMLSFIRRNELFDMHSSSVPLAIEGDSLPVATPEFWDRLPPAIKGMSGGSLIRATEGSVKLDTVGFAQDSTRLYVAVRLLRAAIREAQYRVVATLFYRDGHMARLRLQFQAPRALTALQSQPRDLPLPPGAVGRSFGRRINIVVPLAGVGNPTSLLVHVETMGPLRTPVERSPWALVYLERSHGGQARWAPGEDSAESARAPRSLTH